MGDSVPLHLLTFLVVFFSFFFPNEKRFICETVVAWCDLAPAACACPLGSCRVLRTRMACPWHPMAPCEYSKETRPVSERIENMFACVLQNEEGFSFFLTLTDAAARFCKAHVRRGILGRMLDEILTTRVMVKRAMKDDGLSHGLTNLLNARQLGLKLIANVTLGAEA